MQMNNFQQAIEVLNEEGYSILQIQVNDSGEYMFFIAYRFQEAYFNSAQSVDFNTVEGINITNFLMQNASLSNNRANFLGILKKILVERIIIRLTFSKNIKWYKWDAANTGKKIF